MNRCPRALALLTLLALVVAMAPPALAKKKPGAKTTPGKYTDWKGEIDTLEIVASFQRSSYQKIVVKDFDTAKTPRPEKDDNTFEPVKTVLADPVSAFVEGLSGASQLPVTTGKGGGGTLVVKGTVEEMDPGSRSARYWGGFGAGAARAVLRIEIQDGASGKTLLKIHQERRSGVGVAGGDYVKLMHRNLRKIGEDVALVLNAF